MDFYALPRKRRIAVFSLVAMDDRALLRFLRHSAAELFILASRAGAEADELARLAADIDSEADAMERRLRLIAGRRVPVPSGV